MEYCLANPTGNCMLSLFPVLFCKLCSLVSGTCESETFGLGRRIIAMFTTGTLLDSFVMSPWWL